MEGIIWLITAHFAHILQNSKNVFSIYNHNSTFLLRIIPSRIIYRFNKILLETNMPEEHSSVSNNCIKYTLKCHGGWKDYIEFATPDE